MKEVMAGLFIAVLMTGLASAKELYRSPTAGDHGAYYILETQRSGDLVQVLTSRIGKNNAYTDFSKLRVNCETKQYFVLAGSEEDGAQDNPSAALKDYSKKSKWTSVIKGSSKYDLVMHVCK